MKIKIYIYIFYCLVALTQNSNVRGMDSVYNNVRIIGGIQLLFSLMGGIELLGSGYKAACEYYNQDSSFPYYDKYRDIKITNNFAISGIILGSGFATGVITTSSPIFLSTIAQIILINFLSLNLLDEEAIRKMNFGIYSSEAILGGMMFFNGIHGLYTLFPTNQNTPSTAITPTNSIPHFPTPSSTLISTPPSTPTNKPINNQNLCCFTPPSQKPQSTFHTPKKQDRIVSDMQGDLMNRFVFFKNQIKAQFIDGKNDYSVHSYKHFRLIKKLNNEDILKYLVDTLERDTNKIQREDHDFMKYVKKSGSTYELHTPYHKLILNRSDVLNFVGFLDRYVVEHLLDKFVSVDDLKYFKSIKNNKHILFTLEDGSFYTIQCGKTTGLTQVHTYRTHSISPEKCKIDHGYTDIFGKTNLPLKQKGKTYRLKVNSIQLKSEHLSQLYRNAVLLYNFIIYKEEAMQDLLGDIGNVQILENLLDECTMLLNQ